MENKGGIEAGEKKNMENEKEEERWNQETEQE